MLKDQLKIMYRNLLNDKLHSIISIAGFAIGISSFILVLLYVNQELNIDSFHQNNNRIYKITLGENFYTMAPFSVFIKDKLPEIENVVRIDYDMGGGKSPYLKFNNGITSNTLQVKDIIYADSSFFNIFSFKLVLGNAETSLTQPNSIILNESTAQKIFGTENPVGKTIEYIGTNENPKLICTITGVIEDVPINSSINFNGLISFNTLKSIKPGGVDVDEDYGNWTYDTYVLLKKSGSIENLAQKINKIWMDDISVRRNVAPGSEAAKEYVCGFVPLKEVNFYKNNKHKFIYLILFVGIAIIVIAIINFVNLSIAKASKRSKEIGIRKVNGSGRYDLIKQFIKESVIMTFIAAFFALVIVYFLTPLLGNIIEKTIQLKSFFNYTSVLLFILGIILIGGLAGIYPAFYLSSLKPISILRNGKTGRSKSRFVVQTLIILQFSASIALIISTIVISKQVRYMRTESVGFDKNDIITFKPSKNIRTKYDLFKQNLLQNQNILNVASSSGTWLSEQFHISCTNQINGSEKTYKAMMVDPDFIKTIGLQIVEGRNFLNELETDKYKTVILNEKAVNNFGLKNPVDFEITLFDYKVKVIGVVKDFHNESFQKQISSLVLWYVPGQDYNLSIRIAKNNRQETIQYIKKLWEELSPGIPFEFQFLDEKYDAIYKDEDKFNQVIGYFSVIAIFIACLGLLGIISFTTENRTKEIGVRKVNGAKTFQILTLLNIDSLKWVISAFVIATPFAYYAMYNWLENFAYKTTLNWWIFALAGMIALGIALLTVSWQTWQAARRNPVEALKYE